MKILITGICGFAGSVLARSLKESREALEIFGIDNFIRPGSELNRTELARFGIRVFHGDVRNASDFEVLQKADWVIDAAANPSVLAGVDGRTSARQLLEHNLNGTLNILEYCRAHSAGLILLSTSRVYSLKALTELPLEVCEREYRLSSDGPLPAGVTRLGVSEQFSTEPPVSLYGSTKLASECVALEYAEAFGLPVWINRCGVLAGAGQFGRADQGIFSFWINSHLRRRPLSYIGFSGHGYQVRDCLHPRDLTSLLLKQINTTDGQTRRVQNCSGGAGNSISLARLTEWCDERFGSHEVQSDPRSRPFDIPWMILDSAFPAQWDPKLGIHVT